MLNISSFTGGIASTNGYLFTTEAGDSVAVDAPDGMAEWLEDQGVRLGHLFLTHQHFDHVQDAGCIQKQHGCPVYAFSPYSKDLTLETLFAFATGTHLEVAPFQVTELLEGKSEIQAAGLTWRLQHIPGHSLDSIVFISEAHRQVFGGDVLFLDGVGRADFPGGSMKLLIDGIENKLMTLPDSFQVYPGHGDPTTIGREREENPYLVE